VSDEGRIRDILDRVKTRFLLLSILTAVAGLAGLILLGLAIEVAVDQLVPLPRWLRMLALVTGVGLSGFVAWRRLAGPFSGRVNDLFLARSIEGQYAHLKSGLTTYVQLSGEGEESAALRELVGERVASDVDAVRPEIVVPSREARRKSAFLAGAMAFCLLLIVLSPSGFWFSFKRSLLPIKNVTETRIAEVIPGDAVAYKGKDVEIAVRLEGKLPPAVRVKVTRESSDPAAYDLPIRPDGWYRVLLPGVTESFEYTITAHDASSDDYRIRVAEVPRLKSMAALLQFPAYTGFPARKQDSGTLDAIEGTGVTLEGTATRPLKSAAVVFKGQRIPASDIRGDKFTVKFSLLESSDYSVELTDKDGVVDPEPSKFRAVVRKDTPPQVTVTVPGKNVELPEPGSVNLACRVVDDFGITSLKLTAKINGKIPKVVTLPFPKERLFLSETAIDLKALEVMPGDYVEYFLTVTDNKEPAPQSGQSPSYIITIQSSLPLLTFADANPDVRIEKYRDPLDRKGSVEARTEKMLSEDRTKDAGKTQEPAQRELARKEIHKPEEKKPEGKKDDASSSGPQRADQEQGREDALAKLLEEKKDLVERLLAKAGANDAPGDARTQAKDPAGSRDGDGREESGESRKGDDKGASKDDGSSGAAEKGSETARQGAGKTGREGAASSGRPGKNGGEGENAEPGANDGEPGSGDGQKPGDPGYDESKQNGNGKNSTAKSGSKAGKNGGKGGRPGNSNKDGEPGDNDGDGDGDGDGDDDYDLSHLFPFEECDGDGDCEGHGKGMCRGKGKGKGKGGGSSAKGGKSSGGGGKGQNGAGGNGLGNGGKGGGSGVKGVKEGSGSSSDPGNGGSSGGGTVKAGAKPDGASGGDKSTGGVDSSKGGKLEGSGQKLSGSGKAAGGGGDKVTGVNGAPGQTSKVDDIKGIGNTPRDVKSSNGKSQGNDENGSGGGGFGTVSGIKNRKEKGPDDPQPSKLQTVGDLVKELEASDRGRPGEGARPPAPDGEGGSQAPQDAPGRRGRDPRLRDALQEVTGRRRARPRSGRGGVRRHREGNRPALGKDGARIGRRPLPRRDGRGRRGSAGRARGEPRPGVARVRGAPSGIHDRSLQAVVGRGG
jgi:hypothetical protein